MLYSGTELPISIVVMVDTIDCSAESTVRRPEASIISPAEGHGAMHQQQSCGLPVCVGLPGCIAATLIAPLVLGCGELDCPDVVNRTQQRTGRTLSSDQQVAATLRGVESLCVLQGLKAISGRLLTAHEPEMSLLQLMPSIRTVDKIYSRMLSGV